MYETFVVTDVQYNLKILYTQRFAMINYTYIYSEK